MEAHSREALNSIVEPEGFLSNRAPKRAWDRLRIADANSEGPQRRLQTSHTVCTLSSELSIRCPQTKSSIEG